MTLRRLSPLAIRSAGPWHSIRAREVSWVPADTDLGPRACRRRDPRRTSHEPRPYLAPSAARAAYEGRATEPGERRSRDERREPRREAEPGREVTDPRPAGHCSKASSPVLAGPFTEASYGRSHGPLEGDRGDRGTASRVCRGCSAPCVVGLSGVSGPRAGRRNITTMLRERASGWSHARSRLRTASYASFIDRAVEMRLRSRTAARKWPGSQPYGAS